MKKKIGFGCTRLAQGKGSQRNHTKHGLDLIESRNGYLIPFIMFSWSVVEKEEW
jgi:hypothetical protein